ncbi:MAG: DUF99 family protein [Candidatus Aenigmarchaeota archaeon]|nr:DUF99 family protein [Candidatus Aenigmarchaeota archaeon]
MLKSEIRILGFDDGPFETKTKATTPVIGVIYRGGKFLDGILRTDVEVDGLDSTGKLAKLINSSRHKQQLKVVMLDGITVGGFNIIDIVQLHKNTNIPVIVFNRKHPDLTAVKNALNNFHDFDIRWKMVKNAGKIKECELDDSKKIYYQSIGMSDEDVEETLLLSSTHGDIPEPLRVAHLIATAIVKGESYGRA